MEQVNDDRSGYREVHFSGARGRRGGALDSATDCSEAGCWSSLANFRDVWSARGVRLVTQLGPRVDQARP